jgi:hypothetical protein
MTKRLTESSDGRQWLPELRARQTLDPELFVRLVVTIARGDADKLSGRFLHALDDIDELVERLDEIDSNDLYVLRLRRLEGVVADLRAPAGSVPGDTRK